ncbi:hypothetical protein [Persicobacter sp. CCB-QB2]|uniref:hypothetical protein n=1 Tax=Persicobacter sp. CCB-QB2 TaxID=1561025 RepID=UPI0006A9789F|nr:hypothetical protein [Persicobacter sp. CCB-QB2]
MFRSLKRRTAKFRELDRSRRVTFLQDYKVQLAKTTISGVVGLQGKGVALGNQVVAIKDKLWYCNFLNEVGTLEF